MSFRLSLSSMTDIPEHVVIVVQGSEAGPLSSKAGHSAIGFNILCNTNDVLFIQIRLESNGKEYGETTFSPARFLRENKYNPRLYSQDDILYETSIFDQGEKPCGRLVFGVKYHPGIEYFGEKLGVFESLPERQPVTVSKGVAESKNIFSCMDPGHTNSSFQMIESNYRDESWGRRK